MHDPIHKLKPTWRCSTTPYDGSQVNTQDIHELILHSYGFKLHNTNSSSIIHGMIKFKSGVDQAQHIVMSLRTLGEISEDFSNAQHSYTGPIVIMESTCSIGAETLQYLYSILPPSQRVLIKHEKQTLAQYHDSLRVEVRTGRSEDFDYHLPVLTHRLSSLFVLRSATGEVFVILYLYYYG